ncbi:MAG: type IV pilus assembly protein PilM [bacterium]
MIGQAKRAVGIDIGSQRIKLIVLKKSKKGIELENFFIEAIPFGCIVDHQIVDGFPLRDALSRLLRAAKLRGKEVATALYGKQVMLKKITTDAMSEDELAAAIPYEAEQSLPFDAREVTMDYASLPRDLDVEGMEVLLAAAKNDLVHSIADTLREAGGRPSLLEVEPFALQAVLTENGDLDEKSTLAVLQIGFQASTVTLFQSGQFEGMRDIPVAGKTLVEGLIRLRGIPFERALAVLSRERLSLTDESALEEVVRQTSDKLADAVARSFPSNFGPTAERPVTRLLLCGGGAHFPGIVPVLTERFGIEVELADPLRFVLPVADGREDERRTVAPDLTTAVGLALRGFGDLHPGFNLLPQEERRDAKKGHLAGARVVLPILGMAFLLLWIVIATVVQENKLGILRKNLAEVQREATLYADKIAVVEELTTKRNDIAARINLIEQLDHDRFLRIHILDEVNRALPNLTWLTSVREEAKAGAGRVVIEGVTSSNLKVAELMGNLVASPYFTDVKLTVTEKGDIAHTGVTKFTLQASIKSLSPQKAAPPAKEDAIARGTQAVRHARAQAKQNP